MIRFTINWAIATLAGAVVGALWYLGFYLLDIELKDEDLNA